MKYNSILECIGRTPHVRLARLFPSHQVWLKLERSNPGGSIKDRIAMAMIEEAERQNKIDKDSVVIEATSGNTGIGLAMVCAVKGYRLILVMPESMSIERRRYMLALGAELVLTPREGGMPGAIKKAEELCNSTTKSFAPLQFENLANPEIHRQTTAKEIIEDFPAGLDFLITGVGTGGHVTGCAEALKQNFPRLKVYAVEPEKSQALQGLPHAPHRIQGIGAGFIPQVLNRSCLDDTVAVTEEEAFSFTLRAAKEEGIMLGISSGASLAAVAKKLPAIKNTSTILTFCYDTGERYLSVNNLFPGQE
jgi:cysteine synthase A